VHEQHQPEQPEHLGLVGHQLGEQTTEADRLGREFLADQILAGAGGIALVEDQVHDGEH
jgi:hypothetical protein